MFIVRTFQASAVLQGDAAEALAQRAVAPVKPDDQFVSAEFRDLIMKAGRDLQIFPGIVCFIGIDKRLPDITEPVFLFQMY